MASLKLNGVDKIYPSGTTALYDINLETDEKEFIVILGSDGSALPIAVRCFCAAVSALGLRYNTSLSPRMFAAALTSAHRGAETAHRDRQGDSERTQTLSF